MKRMVSALLCLVLLLSILPVSLSVGAEEEYTEAELLEMFGPLSTLEIVGTADYKKALEAFDLINQVRTEAGKSTVELDGDLTAAAMQRAAESTVLFAHVRPNATEVTTAVKKGDAFLGECLIGHTDSFVDMMLYCMQAEEYRSILLDENGKKARSVGVGAVKVGSAYYWILLFSSAKQSKTVKESSAIPDTRFKVDCRTKLMCLIANASAVEMDRGESFVIQIANINLLLPLEAIPIPTSVFTFASSDPTIVQVSADGCITSKRGGNVTIFVKDRYGQTVLELPVTVYGEHLDVQVTTTVTGNRIPKLVWSRVSGATEYQIYRRVFKDGEWTEYKRYTVTHNLYYVESHLQPGQKASYIVKAYKGEELLDQQEVSAMYLTKPVVQAYHEGEGVKVSWNEVTGATQYTIYRCVYGSNGWGTPTLYMTTKKLSYTDTRIRDGKKVKYYVYAHSGEYKSACTEKTIIHLAQPKITVANAATGVKISWKSTKRDEYNLYRSIYKDGKWGKVVWIKTVDGAKSTYTDTKVKSGQKVKYFVTGQKGGYESARGQGKAIRHLDQPTVKVTKATKGVKVSWKKVTGATTYKVYRSTYRNGKWSDYVLYKATKSTSYVNSSVAKGTRVRYTVYACNGSDKSAFKTGVIIKR